MSVEIADWNDLDNVRNDLTGDYVLVNDLNSETDGYAGIGDDFTPIGVGLDNNFNGTFDGAGFAINNLVVEIDADSVGLFGAVNRDTTNTVVIQNLSVSGSVTNTGSSSRTGGLAGFLDNDGDGEIINCVSHVDVTSDGNRVGGLFGENRSPVTESYATGSVEGDEQVGGLVGRNDDATVTESYATGSVEGGDEVGGLVGNDRDGPNDISNSYADSETTNQSVAIGSQDDDDYTNVTTLTTAEMQGSAAETNMDGFDFENVWNTVLESDDDASEDGYPILLSVDRENQLDAQGILIEFNISVETNAATDIGNFSATLNGELVDLDDEATDADVFFEFGETVDQNQTPTQTLTEPATFDELIDELEPNTTFEFRAVAEAQDAEDNTFTDEGDTLTFDTEIVTVNGTITLDETAAEDADVIVYNLTQDTFEGRVSTDTNGDYSVDLPDANREDTVAVAVDFADGLERYGRLITTVIE